MSCDNAANLEGPVSYPLFRRGGGHQQVLRVPHTHVLGVLLGVRGSADAFLQDRVCVAGRAWLASRARLRHPARPL
eukprot:11156215-Lingulodinium_polyedra.AAC.1